MEIKNLGLINYSDALSIQQQTRDAVSQGADEVIICCNHPAIVTLGKQSSPADIVGWTGDTVNTSRGGKATYHGPGQVVLYPIINLSKRNNDLHLFVRNLELACIETLQEFNLNAVGNPDGTPKTTGVWVGEKKIASIGVAVKKWISYHGIALNVKIDPLAFSGINPCGFSTSTMSSMEELLEAEVNLGSVRDLFSQKLQSRLHLLK